MNKRVTLIVAALMIGLPSAGCGSKDKPPAEVSPEQQKSMEKGMKEQGMHKSDMNKKK